MTIVNRYFDIIFSNQNIQQNLDEFSRLIQMQESGSQELVSEVVMRMNKFRERLLLELGASFYVGFGYSITSTTLSAISVLPRKVIAGVDEFPPILRGIFTSRIPVVGVIDLEKRDFFSTEKEKDWNGGAVLLLSHVSYLNGIDLCFKGLEEVLHKNPSLKEAPLHLIIDGAHAINNHFSVADIPALEKRFRQSLSVASFTYIFDLYKWVQGVAGMAVVVSTAKDVLENVQWVFPNTFSYDTSEFTFHAPTSVSFNPALLYWLINLRCYCDRLFNPAIIEENFKLRNYFLSNIKVSNCFQLGPIDTNLVSLKTSEPAKLYDYLLKQKIYTHLMGGRTITSNEGVMQKYASVRLAFHGGLANFEDADYLINVLQSWSC